jgi:hypothetical protein
MPAQYARQTEPRRPPLDTAARVLVTTGWWSAISGKCGADEELIGTVAEPGNSDGRKYLDPVDCHNPKN